MRSKAEEEERLRAFWEERAPRWTDIYDGTVDLRTYNFLCRKGAVERLLQGERGENLLDVGCGTADYADVAIELGAGYVGVDFSHAMLRHAVQRRGGATRLAVASGERLPFASESFDLAIAIGYLGWVTDARAALVELRRVLRPGGRLVVQAFRRDLLSAVTHHVLRRRRSSSTAGAAQDPNARPYTGRELDRLAAEAGLRRVGREHVHFKVFPQRLRERLPDLSIRLSELLTRWQPPFAWLLATNHVVKYERGRPEEHEVESVTLR